VSPVNNAAGHLIEPTATQNLQDTKPCRMYVKRLKMR
jgi:hypothetical protein